MEIKYIRFLNVYKISIRTSLNYLNLSKLDKYHPTIRNIEKNILRPYYQTRKY